jgi:large subunit ribosomal protein L9
MKIILSREVKNLGGIGDVRDVADGYARNFLIPRGLAEPATAQALKKSAELLKEKEKEKKERVKNAQRIIDALKDKVVTIKVKARGKKLFGSVGAKEIAAGLKKTIPEIGENNIKFEKPIKTTGKFSIGVAIGPDHKTAVQVEVEGL